MRHVMRALIPIILSCFAALPVNADTLFNEDEAARLLLGQIRFHALKGEHYQALQLVKSNRVLAEQDIRERLQQGEPGVEDVTLADITLAYRMNAHAGHAMQDILDADIELQARNQGAYQLARQYYDKQQYDFARHALDLIRGDLYPPLEHDVAWLAAMLQARSGETDAAIISLRQLQGHDRYGVYAGFNRAHLMLQQGQLDAGLAGLERIGLLKTDDETAIALRDKANLVIGYHYLNKQQTVKAVTALSRVSLDGVFTNRALLGMAWAHMHEQDYDAAIVPWTYLSQRVPVDAAVLESLVAIPYIYSKLGATGQSAQMYERAVAALDAYQARLQFLVEQVESGDILLAAAEHIEADVPGLPATRQLLTELFASADYVQARKNVIELEELLGEANRHEQLLQTSQAMVQQRKLDYVAARERYATALASITAKLAVAEERQSQLESSIEILARDSRGPSAVASPALLYASLQDTSTMLDSGEQDVAAVASEPRTGLQLATLLQQREELQSQINRARQRYDHLQDGLQRATDYSEFEVPLTTNREKLRGLRQRLQASYDQQAEQISEMTLTALNERLDLMQRYASVARYELAKTYDSMVEREEQ